MPVRTGSGVLDLPGQNSATIDRHQIRRSRQDSIMNLNDIAKTGLSQGTILVSVVIVAFTAWTSLSLPWLGAFPHFNIDKYMLAPEQDSSTVKDWYRC